MNPLHELFKETLANPELLFEELLKREMDEQQMQEALANAKALREAIFLTFNTPFGRIVLRWMEEEFQNRSSLNLTNDGFKTEVREGMRLVYLLIRHAIKQHERERKDSNHGNSPNTSPNLESIFRTWRDTTRMGHIPASGDQGQSDHSRTL